ncbi:MAG: hypothetical protein NC218_11810 [Acetobacter sp.]|nr:hypothetical protein [Acetobacter sp.]
MTIRLWLDDIRPIPQSTKYWLHAKSVNEAKVAVEKFFEIKETVGDFEGHDTWTLILDLDHDLGKYAKDGGDAIKLLDWIEAEGINTTDIVFKIHTANPVGRQNMLQVIRKNKWREY